MVNVKYIYYKSLFHHNIINIPNDINLLKIYEKNYNNIKFYDIPKGLKNLIIIGKKKYDIIKFYDIPKGIKKILFVNNEKDNVNNYLLSCDDFQYLAIIKNNVSIDLSNIPFCVKVLDIFTSKNMNLDYLPCSIERIIIRENNYNTFYDLSNLPNSVKEIYFINMTFVKSFISILNKIPTNIEMIYIDTLNNHCLLTELKNVKFPSKLKLLKIGIVSTQKDLITKNLFHKMNYNVELC